MEGRRNLELVFPTVSLASILLWRWLLFLVKGHVAHFLFPVVALNGLVYLYHAIH